MYEVIYFWTDRGEHPVKEFICFLQNKSRLKVERSLVLLSAQGPFLKRPYADKVKGEIYELRVRFGSDQIRVLYSFILGRGMMKKSKLSDEELKKHSFRTHLDEELKDPKFAGDFEEGWRKLKLGYQVFCARETVGMTQQALAKKIGTRQSNISRLEQGDYNFTVEMLQKIATALHLQLRIELKGPETKQAA